MKRGDFAFMGTMDRYLVVHEIVDHPYTFDRYARSSLCIAGDEIDTSVTPTTGSAIGLGSYTLIERPEE